MLMGYALSISSGPDSERGLWPCGVAYMRGLLRCSFSRDGNAKASVRGTGNWKWHHAFYVMAINIGEKIEEIFRSGPRHHTVEWLASQIPCDRRNVYHIFQRSNIDVNQLRRISTALHHNFFQDLADDFNKDSTS